MRRLLLVCLALTLLSVVVTAADRFVPPPTTQLYGRMIPYPIQPSSIDYPEYTKPGVEKQYTITVLNYQDSTATVLAINFHEDSTKPAAPSGWLNVSNTFSEIPPQSSRSLTLELNNSGVVTTALPTVLYGRLVFRLALWSDTSEATLPIRFIVADTIILPEWDTVATECGIPLTVATNGNMGARGKGGANLNFPQPSPECDTGSNSPGDADLYLFDASPVIVRNDGDSYRLSLSAYRIDDASPYSFRPLDAGIRGHFSAEGWDGFRTGTFCTTDSLVKVERTYWAPTGATNPDSCHFMIIRTRYWPYTINQSVNGLAIGDLFDFDIPSQLNAFGNLGGVDHFKQTVWVRGYDHPGTTGCYDNNLRYAGARFLTMYFKNCSNDSLTHGAFNETNDSLFDLSGSSLDTEKLWSNMRDSGYSTYPEMADLHSVLVYKNNSNGAGFTLPANDTLTIWSAVAVVRPSGGTVEQGLDSLYAELDKARQWLDNVCNCCGTCCFGARGNVISPVWTQPNLSDLSYLIAYFTQTPRPYLPCGHEANVNGSYNGIDLSDLSLLIAFLTQTPRPTLPKCP